MQQLTGLAPLGILPHLRGSELDPDALASALLQAIGSKALDRLLTLATGSPSGAKRTSSTGVPTSRPISRRRARFSGATWICVTMPALPAASEVSG